MKHLLTLGVLAAAFVVNASATAVIGYSNGNQGRTTTFRTATTHTGLAVKFPAEKLKLLKGHKITAVNTSVGSMRSTNGSLSVFISTSLDGTPAVSEEHAISKANAWVDYELATPYTITGDEPALYVGYTMDIPSTYSPLSADRSVQMEGVSYALYGDEWSDIASLGLGQGNVRMVLDNDPAITDIVFKPLAFNGYYKEGEAYDFTGKLLNFGTTRIENFNVKLKIGDAEPEVFPVTEAVEPGSEYTFKIPSYTSRESGSLEVLVSAEDVNGGVDSDPTDNEVGTKVYFYPSDMERSILLEGFTGQECGNCPTGHRTIERVMEAWEATPGHTEVIEVMHHAGYYPDMFTMQEDMEYTTLYGGSTFAPAAAVNRRWNADQNAPAFTVAESTLKSMLAEADAAVPYVALSLESDFDPDTRKLNVKVGAYTYDEIPSEVKTINVMLCQNNMTAYQSAGGSSYIHSHVFRGALTGNAWGVQKACEPGTTETLEVSYTIPEGIRSSYWTDERLAAVGGDAETYTLTAVPEDMYLVAYVSTYNAVDNSKRIILNCAQVPLGGKKVQNGYSGIEDVPVAGEEAAPEIRVANGFVEVGAACRSIDVYNLQGARVANGHVSGGVFVVRVVTEAGNVYVEKVLAK